MYRDQNGGDDDGHKTPISKSENQRQGKSDSDPKAITTAALYNLGSLGIGHVRANVAHFGRLKR